MKECSKAILTFSFVLITTILFSQNEQLIIGRTTGKLILTNNAEIRTFGFANSLSGQITFPGSSVEVKVGDTVNIDFWNISQGNPVSLHCKEIEFTQRDKENEILKIKEPVHHMEHGFYSFQAKKAGTYLYYSPENYPFNLQAGMFGVIIIRPKENDSLQKKPFREILWCSNELDPIWHTDSIMGTEYDSSNKPIILPDFKPDYFLLNGEIIQNKKGLQSLENKNETILLRLVNAGLYQHEIVFPINTKIQLVTGNSANLKLLPKGYKVQLGSGECLELYAFLGETAEKEKIIYRFIDPKSKKLRSKAVIPVFY